MAKKPTNNTESPLLDQLLASLPKPRFGNGFAVGTVHTEEYVGSPEIFLNVPKEGSDVAWNINIVDDSGDDIIPTISCFGTRHLFHIEEVIYHHDDDATPDQRLENVMYQKVGTSLAVNFSPVAPPSFEVAYIEVKYKGLTARVQWEWDTESEGVVVSDFEGNRLLITLKGEMVEA